MMDTVTLRTIRKTKSEDLEVHRDLPQQPTIFSTDMNRFANHCARAHSYGSITLQDSRPLPSPPLSAPVRMRTVRPLPLPPPTPLSSKPEVRITPPSPPIVSTISLHKSSSTSVLRSPSYITAKQKPFASLSLQTSPDFLHPPSINESEEFVLSPLSPSIPLTPSPSDARRKRMKKLRRHLGESVIDSKMFMDVALDQKILPINEGEETHNLSGLVFSKTTLDLHDGSSTSDESEESLGHDVEQEEEDIDGDGLCWAVDNNNSASFRADTLRRLSKKWVREKGGHRWEEQDYSDILRTLRSLR